jgi:hypothetical protein
MGNVYSGSDPKNKLRVREVDGTPNVFPVSTIVVSNGTLTNDGAGQVTITTGGGGGGSGTVTSVAFSTGTTGLSVTGSPITTSGTITLSGTLGLANGGTGIDTSSVIDGQLLVGGGAANDFQLATITAGNLIGITNGTNSILIDCSIQAQPAPDPGLGITGVIDALVAAGVFI